MPRRSWLEIIVAVLGWSMLALFCIVVCVVALFFWGLSRPRPEPPAKVDSDELRQFINIDMPISAVKWEIFRSPDDSFFPAPDVYTVLIAEIELSDPSWKKPYPLVGTRNAVMPESSRAWLSQPFKDLMHRSRTDDHALANFKCGEFATSIKSSGRIVDGFICPSSGKVMFYLLVDQPPTP